MCSRLVVRRGLLGWSSVLIPGIRRLSQAAVQSKGPILMRQHVNLIPVQQEPRTQNRPVVASSLFMHSFL